MGQDGAAHVGDDDMKLIRAIIRPEREGEVTERLEAAGIYAMTKIPVLGRGQQRGIRVGAVSYDTLSKVMLLLAVEDGDYEKTLGAITSGAHTGHPGDGRIFVQNLSEVYTIRSGRRRKNLA